MFKASFDDTFPLFLAKMTECTLIWVAYLVQSQIRKVRIMQCLQLPTFDPSVRMTGCIVVQTGASYYDFGTHLRLKLKSILQASVYLQIKILNLEINE